MSYEIHGRAVIDLILASGRTFTRPSLVAYIKHHFGVSTHFCTCSRVGLTAEELVDFLAESGKFRGTAEAFTVNSERVCQH